MEIKSLDGAIKWILLIKYGTIGLMFIPQPEKISFIFSPDKNVQSIFHKRLPLINILIHVNGNRISFQLEIFHYHSTFSEHRRFIFIVDFYVPRRVNLDPN